MEGAAGPYNGRTVEEVFKDFKGRRAGMIKALTTDVLEFYQQCDPGKEKLCLYGYPNETWEVNLPAEELPSDLPEPALGINFARDRMQEKGWLSLVAVHSDAWLLAVASYFAARFGFEKNDRGCLFNMINELPTIFELVTGTNPHRSIEGAAGPYNGRTVEQVFKGCRAGMIKALTTEVKEFYQQCDPERDKLCLYGIHYGTPNDTWGVYTPAVEVPPLLPDPTLGINFARDAMQEKDWLSLVAVHSDAWLLAVAFFSGAHSGFEKNDRGRLFNMINELPTIFEVVKKQTKEKPSVTNHNGIKSTGTVKKQTKEKPSVINHNGNISKPNAKVQRVSESQRKVPKLQPPHKEEDDTLDEEDEEEHGNMLCGACGENYASDEFWICCDMCEIWFHGECVKLTPQRAAHIKQYKCPSCSSLDEEDEEEHGDMLCGACGENYASDEFWICCDMCEIWFHGQCVKLTPQRAAHIKQYKCPSCSSSTKRARA